MSITTHAHSVWSIQRVLLLLLMTILIPVLFIQAWIYYGQFHSWRNEEMQSNLELARAVASTFDGYINGILTQELILGTALSESPSPSPEQARRLLTAAVKAYPTILRFNWVDPTGRIIASSEPKALGLDVSHRYYAVEILAGNDWVVSDLYQAMVGGQPTFAIARGMRDARGRLHGIIVGLVNPSRLGQVIALQRVSNGAIAISDRRGWLVYRDPYIDIAWPDRKPHRSGILSRALSGEETKGILVSRFDSRARMGSAVPIRSIGWAIAATRPVDKVMEPIARRLFRDFGLLLAIILVALLFALHLSNTITIPLHRLRNHARAVGQGQLACRADIMGPHELRELAKVFNEMGHQLKLREEERDVYVHTLSHDLRNPLTIILGNIEFLQEAIKHPDELAHTQSSIDAMLVGVHRMNAMIQDLIDFARLDAGEFSTAPILLQQFIPTLLDRYRIVFDTRRIQVSLPDHLPAVAAHATRLERILINLFTNALKYSLPGTPVTLQAVRRDGMVRLSITDQGTTIADDDLPCLFNRFYRAKGAREQDGLGLGLYITKMLVEAHQGRIWVENVAEEGCTFHFTLPVADEHTA